MKTCILSTPAGMDHLIPADHAEQPARLAAVMEALSADAFAEVETVEAREASRAEIARLHDADYIDRVFDAAPQDERLFPLDWDTWMSKGSLKAALQAAGAGVHGVDRVMTGAAEAVFGATRPPGHHAEPGRAMGFCFFNTIGVAALHALEAHGLSRAAIIDIDVHHGNGSQCLAERDERVFVASIHQSPLYPGTGAAHETGLNGNVVNCPMPEGTAGREWRARIEAEILPTLADFAPDIVCVSAGFDGHLDDPLGGFALLEEDFAWAASVLARQARSSAESRLVSVLEGGYDIPALGRSAAAFVRALIDS